MIKHMIRIIVLAGLSMTAIAAPYASNVMINGYLLNTYELAALERQIGVRIAPGVYLANQGCWVNLTTGQSGCLGGSSGQYSSRYGSGERNSQGNWSHWSDMAGGGVGGTSDGCIYAFNWSNC